MRTEVQADPFRSRKLLLEDRFLSRIPAAWTLTTIVLGIGSQRAWDSPLVLGNMRGFGADDFLVGSLETTSEVELLGIAGDADQSVGRNGIAPHGFPRSDDLSFWPIKLRDRCMLSAK